MYQGRALRQGAGRVHLVVVRLAVMAEAMLLNDLPMSAVYRVKGSGPRTEPWGTPHVTGQERLSDYLVRQTGIFLQGTSAGIRAGHHENRMTFRDDAAGCCGQPYRKLQISLKETVVQTFRSRWRRRGPENFEDCCLGRVSATVG